MTIGRYRARIFRLSEALQRLRQAPEDLKLLEALQLSILELLKRTEKRNSALQTRKSELKRKLRSARLPKLESSAIRKAILACESDISSNKWLLTIWRSFGDGIAFIYLDKWAIKPLLYDPATREEKSGCGSVRGKAGQRHEIRILRRLLSQGCPALLADITNCIRHGDICLLNQSDPTLLEVKSSANQNARTIRQSDAIESIHDFLATDQTVNLPGGERIRRIALPSSEVHYRDLFDLTISGALARGSCYFTPEPSIRLVAIANRKPRDLDRALSDFSPSILHFLNEAKNEGGWSVYYPYTLSIQDPANLFSFLNGDVVLIVAFSYHAVAAAARRRSLRFKETGDPIWPVQLDWKLNKSDQPTFSRISVHYLNRMGYELLSWKWTLSVERARFVEFDRAEVLAETSAAEASSTV